MLSAYFTPLPSSPLPLLPLPPPPPPPWFDFRSFFFLRFTPWFRQIRETFLLKKTMWCEIDQMCHLSCLCQLVFCILLYTKFAVFESPFSLASAVLVQVVRGRHQNGFIDFFPPAFVNLQIPRQIDRRFLSEWSLVQVRSAPKSLLLHFFFSFPNWGLRKF